MKCNEGISNRVSNILRIYIDHMKFAAYMAFPFCALLSNFCKVCIFNVMFM